MKIAVLGLWHLGLVTAASLAAEGHDVCAIDDPLVIAALEAGRLPIQEPGLTELVAQNRLAGRLTFASASTSGSGFDLIWVCYDTPVDDEDRADVPWVVDRTLAFLDTYRDRAVVAISSQLPVGSIAELRRRCGGDRFTFACIPENLRLGSAIENFRRPDRVVVGTGEPAARTVLEAVLSGFVGSLVWTSIESAEVVKHAINAYLATSVVFANEIAAVCERVGADAREVERGLKTDVRIGQRAYVRAGEAFAGGTLARDLAFLAEVGTREGVGLAQLRATAASNERHREWAFEQTVAVLGTLEGASVALLGLVYKPGTDTLRASSAVALARRLSSAGAKIVAYDPAIGMADLRLEGLLELAPSAEVALEHADIAVIATSWPQFRDLDPAVFAGLRRHLVIDEARFLEQQLESVVGLEYVAFGRPSGAVQVAG